MDIFTWYIGVNYILIVLNVINSVSSQKSTFIWSSLAIVCQSLVVHKHYVIIARWVAYGKHMTLITV